MNHPIPTLADRARKVWAKILADCDPDFDSDQITDRATLAVLGGDGLDLFEIKLTAEETFGIEIDDDRFTLDTTFGAFCRMLAPSAGTPDAPEHELDRVGTPGGLNF